MKDLSQIEVMTAKQQLVSKDISLTWLTRIIQMIASKPSIISVFQYRYSEIGFFQVKLV